MNMLKDILLLNKNYFNSLLKILKEKELNNPFFSIENFCFTSPLYEINSNLLPINFDKLYTIHSKFTPKNILWATIVDSTINQFDFKVNDLQIIKKIENIGFEPIAFFDVKYENYRLLFHYFNNKDNNDFSSIIIVIKGIPDNPTDIINFDNSIEK